MVNYFILSPLVGVNVGKGYVYYQVSWEKNKIIFKFSLNISFGNYYWNPKFILKQTTECHQM